MSLVDLPQHAMFILRLSLVQEVDPVLSLLNNHPP
jgi:hypothetical protein